MRHFGAKMRLKKIDKSFLARVALRAITRKKHTPKKEKLDFLNATIKRKIICLFLWFVRIV